ncbi:MAG: S8 family serine peptidase, partial [Paludibacteraceae bacterium]|nr:S8 family serine peptidase [Paludibacteraceae bacterium]
MKKIFLICVAAFSFSALSAQSEKMSAYTQWLVSSVNDRSLLQSQPQNQMVSAFVFTRGENVNVDSLARVYGATVVYPLGDMFTANIPVDRIAACAADERVDYIEVGAPVKQQVATARTFCGVNQVQSGAEGLPYGFKGDGVLVGVVDLGLQYDHIAFYDPNDNYQTLRVKKVLDISKSYVFEDQEEIEEAGKDVSYTDGHGTHVANIAAGSYADETNNFRGVAPESDILLATIGTSGNQTAILNEVIWMLNYAESVGKPVVVNLSLGTEQGPHDGLSVFDVKLNEKLGAGKILVGAAGNYGSAALYVENELAVGASSVNYLDPTKLRSAINDFVDIWGDENKNYTVTILFADTDGDVKYTRTVTSGSSYTVPTDFGTGKVKVTKSQGKYNYKNEVYLALENFSVKNGYKFGVQITATQAGTVRMWGGSNSTVWEGVTSTSGTVY